MQTAMFMSYASSPDGGVLIKLHRADDPDGYIATMPHDHEGALRAAAYILCSAGVERAEYENGHLQEMRRP